MHGHARKRLALSGAVALTLLTIAGCGSSGSSHQRSAANKRASAQQAAVRHTRANRRQQILAEASDITQYSTCEEWLGTSATAREAYLLKNWPHLHPKQVVRVVHDQSISCKVVPREGPRTAMDPLQASVDLVVGGLAIFYEETLAVGIKESIDQYDLRAMNFKFAPPLRPSLLHHRHSGTG
jgi:hypothetical protein